MGIFKDIEELWRRQKESESDSWFQFGGQTGEYVDVPSMRSLLAEKLTRAHSLPEIDRGLVASLEAAQDLDTPAGRVVARGIFRDYLHQLNGYDGDLLSEAVGRGDFTEVDKRAISCWRAMQLIDSLPS